MFSRLSLKQTKQKRVFFLKLEIIFRNLCQTFRYRHFIFQNFFSSSEVFHFGSSKFEMSQIPRPKGGIPVRSGNSRPQSRIPQSCAVIVKPTLAGKSVHETIAAHKLKQENARIIREGGTYGNVVRKNQLLNAPKVVSKQQVGQNKKDYVDRIQQKKLVGKVKKFGAQPLPNTDCKLLPPTKLQTLNNFPLSRPSRRRENKAYSSESSPASRRSEQNQRKPSRSPTGGSKQSF